MSLFTPLEPAEEGVFTSGKVQKGGFTSRLEALMGAWLVDTQTCALAWAKAEKPESNICSTQHALGSGYVRPGLRQQNIPCIKPVFVLLFITLRVESRA